MANEDGIAEEDSEYKLPKKMSLMIILLASVYKRPLHFACGSALLGNVLYSLAYCTKFLYLILIGRIVSGFAFTFFLYSKRYCSDPRIVGIRRRTTLAGWLVLGQGAGFSIGPFIGVGLSNSIFNGYTSPTWILAGIWGIFWIFAALLYKDVPRAPEASGIELGSVSTSEEANNRLEELQNSEDQPAVIEVQPSSSFEHARMSGPQWGVIATMCWFAMTCFFILGAWEANIPVFTSSNSSLSPFHFSPFAAGNLIALGGICTFPFLFLNVFLARRVQDRHALAAGASLGTTGLILACIIMRTHAVSYGSLFACWFLVALGFNLTSTVTFSLLSKQLPGAWNARISHAIQYSNYVGRVCGAVWGGAGVRVGMLNYVGMQAPYQYHMGKKGRHSFSQNLSGEELFKWDWASIGYNLSSWVGRAQFRSSYNIGAGCLAAVLYEEGRGDSRTSVLHTMKWGVEVPQSAPAAATTSTQQALEVSVNNSSQAAAPTATLRHPLLWVQAEGLMGRSVSNHCAIVCQGYFVSHKGRMYFVRRQDHQLMFLAGAYIRSKGIGSKENTDTWTFRIITHSSIQPFKQLSSRPPVILRSSSAIQTWLDTSFTLWNDQLMELVQPTDYAEYPLEYYEVSLRVNDPQADGPALILPISPETTVTEIPLPPPPPPANQPPVAPPKKGGKRRASANKSSGAAASSQPDETQAASAHPAGGGTSSAAASSSPPAMTGRKRKRSPGVSSTGSPKKKGKKSQTSSAPSASVKLMQDWLIPSGAALSAGEPLVSLPGPEVSMQMAQMVQNIPSYLAVLPSTQQEEVPSANAVQTDSDIIRDAARRPEELDNVQPSTLASAGSDVNVARDTAATATMNSEELGIASELTHDDDNTMIIRNYTMSTHIRPPPNCRQNVERTPEIIDLTVDDYVDSNGFPPTNAAASYPASASIARISRENVNLPVQRSAGTARGSRERRGGTSATRGKKSKKPRWSEPHLKINQHFLPK
ncbi:hypothetical protein OBBRIDRAFT_835419 [Obba rivulosa]|uniref:Uncharacterized protein n=1 Tax=Obba rivulosa TaxID=1052685 RepID=A0A8E2DK16_9APHY|nr:hypothetical protein OBBRIDRAFT_835419 [Obba rivulosa]